MNTEDLLELAGDESFYLELLESKVPNATSRFFKACKSLKKLQGEIKKHFPEAQYYMSAEGLNLMLGEPHTGTNISGNEQLSVCQGDIGHTEAGDW